jgi:hypothetical protein
LCTSSDVEVEFKYPLSRKNAAASGQQRGSEGRKLAWPKGRKSKHNEMVFGTGDMEVP